MVDSKFATKALYEVFLASPSSFTLAAYSSASVGSACCSGIAMASQLDGVASLVTSRPIDGRLYAAMAAK